VSRNPGDVFDGVEIMPTFLKRKYMRGRPSLLERALGAGALATLAIIVISFLLTGGWFGGGVTQQALVADAKAILGMPTEPLFTVKPGNQKTALPALGVRVGEALLPERVGDLKRVPTILGDSTRGCEAISLATSNRREGNVSEVSGEPGVDGGTAKTPSQEEIALTESAAASGGLWLYRGSYAGGRGQDDYVTAFIVDMGVPDKAREWCRGRKPADGSVLSLGREGWRSADGRRIGFWTGRYCTELASAASTFEAKALSDIAAALAGRQLVYGGEPFAPETAAGAGGQNRPAAAASQSAGQGPPGRARFADPGDPTITVPTRFERYTDNLYEKINGREGQYRSFNFVELRFAQYVDTRGQQTFDTYLYDMAEPVNAMGIYMVERSPDAKPIPLGREGYISGSSAYFWKGQYYVNVLGPAEGDANASDIALRIARAIADTVADDGQPMWADKLLPTQDRLPDSLTYEATSALGYDFLGRLFKANYRTGETTYQAFLIKADSPQAAADLFKKLVEATAKYDHVLARQPSAGGETFVGQSLDVFSVCFHKGVYLGGILECEDQALARKKAAELREGLAVEGER